MTPEAMSTLHDELEQFLDEMTFGMGRTERRAAMKAYARGLLLDGERKSLEPIAARISAAPEQAEAWRQRLQQAISVADWDQSEVFRRVAVRVGHELPGISAIVVDDTGIPKKGRHSVGVARQYTGTLGRIENCQVVTSLHLASEVGGACVGARVYLPREWTDDAERLAEVGVPADISFLEKGRIALTLLDDLLDAGLGRWPVVADAGYGDSSEFRGEIARRGLKYVVGVTGTATIWRPGFSPGPPPKKTGKPGRPRTKWLGGDESPVAMATFAEGLPDDAWRLVTWKEGSRGPQSGYFAAVRVRTAHGHSQGKPPGDEQWLLCEKTYRKKKPTTYYLSNLPKGTSLKQLVFTAKIRWRIERDYQEMKGELGFDHFEGRTWRGLHHHIALVAASHAFLTLRRAFSPRRANARKVPRRASASAARPLPDVLPADARAGATDGRFTDVIA
jgi:SRSO17 transposase